MLNCFVEYSVTFDSTIKLQGRTQEFWKGFPLRLSDCYIRVVYITWLFY